MGKKENLAGEEREGEGEERKRERGRVFYSDRKRENKHRNT